MHISIPRQFPEPDPMQTQQPSKSRALQIPTYRSVSGMVKPHFMRQRESIRSSSGTAVGCVLPQHPPAANRKTEVSQCSTFIDCHSLVLASAMRATSCKDERGSGRPPGHHCSIKSFCSAQAAPNRLLSLWHSSGRHLLTTPTLSCALEHSQIRLNEFWNALGSEKY